MDQLNCPIYAQLLDFQNDLTRHELIFNDPNSSTQAYLQTLARGLSLEFEYSTITNSARILRRLVDHPQKAQPALEEDILRFLDLEQSSIAQTSVELPISHDVPSSRSAGLVGGFWVRSQDEMRYLSSQPHDAIFSFESAFPELGILGHSLDDYEPAPLNSCDLDLNGEVLTSDTIEEQNSPGVFLANLSGLPSADNNALILDQGPILHLSSPSISSPKDFKSSYKEAAVSSEPLSDPRTSPALDLHEDLEDQRRRADRIDQLLNQISRTRVTMQS